MAAGGADFRQILEHYYPHTTLVKAHPIAAASGLGSVLEIGLGQPAVEGPAHSCV